MQKIAQNLLCNPEARNESNLEVAAYSEGVYLTWD